MQPCTISHLHLEGCARTNAQYIYKLDFLLVPVAFTVVAVESVESADVLD